MRFDTPLIPAVLIRRYKRFLADVRLADGREVVAHCPNPGSMMGLAEAGMRIWLEPNNDPKKKLKYGWRLVEHSDGNFTGIDTGRANRIVAEALLAKKIVPLLGYGNIRSEVKYGTGSRVDFLLTGEAPDCYLEVKSATLMREAPLVEFPDSVTARGAKHLAELSQMVAVGHRAVLLFLVQRTGATNIDVARDLDRKYADAFDLARGAGVEFLAYGCEISPERIELSGQIPFDPRK
ncbi:DNA/RNA nuclease SfsA [Falsihalocynthiibacter arcticus]|uniref:Sugar fermentation stimulation protein homolog n=1 Tax=Falsihalocynthiibacter arcticus TaxID=1579316 RepID=A0A126UYC3_9RHOB|nr:DNA/RNA nuclease SfsA [Falsihalocynthiibacter arcticus]AML50646.1 sugar fermentation stimulation protein [Falsihalocynthiibacter arcticus]